MLKSDGSILVHSDGGFAKYTRNGAASWWVDDGVSLWKCQWEGGGLINGKTDGLLYPVGRVKALGDMTTEEAAAVLVGDAA